MQTNDKVVWHVISNRWFSAITAYGLHVAQALNLRPGWRNVVSLKAGTPGQLKAEQKGLEVIALPGFSWKELSNFRQAYLQLNPDIIFLYGGPETFLLWLCPRGDKRVLRFRGAQKDLKAPSRWSWAFDRFVADTVFVPSVSVARAAAEVASTAVVPFGVDTQVFHYQPTLKPKQPVIVVFGRFDPVKGHREFLAFFHKVIEHWPVDGPKPLLRFVGSEANISMAQLQQCIDEKGLQAFVEVECAHIEQPAQLMSQATCGVICSLDSEVICRVGAEFLCCGAPVAVRPVGSLADLLIEQGFGIVYDEDAPQEFAEFICQAFEESDDQRRCRALHAQKVGGVEAMADALEALLCKVE